MFKRVKSLLIAGALVLGMSATAFADGNTVTEPTWNLSVGTVQNNVRTIKASDMIKEGTWRDFVEEVNSIQNGFVIVEEDGVFKVYLDADYDNNYDEGEQLIETINIEYLVVNEGGLQKGFLENITPETGDAIAIGGAVVGMASIGALAFVNKKRK